MSILVIHAFSSPRAARRHKIGWFDAYDGRGAGLELLLEAAVGPPFGPTEDDPRAQDGGGGCAAPADDRLEFALLLGAEFESRGGQGHGHKTTVSCFRLLGDAARERAGWSRACITSAAATFEDVWRIRAGRARGRLACRCRRRLEQHAGLRLTESVDGAALSPWTSLLLPSGRRGRGSA
ncbi:MAG: hypothetical protein QXN56_03670 [Candidatus Hadarchaeum sp.]